jgi:hypothetical protein
MVKVTHVIPCVLRKTSTPVIRKKHNVDHTFKATGHPSVWKAILILVIVKIV